MAIVPGNRNERAVDRGLPAGKTRKHRPPVGGRAGVVSWAPESARVLAVEFGGDGVSQPAAKPGGNPRGKPRGKPRGEPGGKDTGPPGTEPATTATRRLAVLRAVAAFASLALLPVFCAFLPGSSAAQSSIATDGTLPGVAAGDLTGPDYRVTEALGTRVGNSQFHSFERFGLATGETVTFSGPAAIRRIVSRVTGGSLSSIDGLIRSEISGADFYLINPAGVVFGPNASLDVPGNVVISTADYVELGSDGVFSAVDPGSSVLSASPIAAFGFLSSSPAPIEVLGSQLETDFIDFSSLVGRSLSLVGGDLEIRGSGQPGELTFLYSRGGRINLASVGAPSRVRITPTEGSGDPPGLEIETQGELGDIFVGDGAVVSSGGPPPDVGVCAGRTGCFVANGSGDIFVRARNLTLEDGEIRALTVTDRDAGRVDVELTGDLVARSVDETETTGVFAISGLENTFPGEGFLLFQEQLLLPEGPYTFEVETTLGGDVTRVTYPGTGRGGDIRIRAANVRVEGFAEISSEAVFGGDAGDITIVADESVSLDASGRSGDFGSVLTNARGGGDGGAIAITTPDLRITDNGRILSEVREGAGRGGTITLDVERLVASADGRIDSSTRGSGDGGAITIGASDSVLLTGQVNEGTFSGVSTLSQTDGTGNAGRILIATPDLRLENGARVTTTALGPGDAGTIDLRADSIRLVGSEVLAESDLGLGGDLYINGGPVVVQPNGGLDIDAPPGLAPGSLLTLEDSSISTSVRGGGGGGGDVAVRSDTIVLIDSQLLAQAVDGAGGNMAIEASAIVLDEASRIDATSLFSQDGTIETSSPTLIIRGERPDLPIQIQDATAFLRERCAARSGDAAASLVLRTRSGLPSPPDGLLAARTPRVSPSATPATAKAARRDEPQAPAADESTTRTLSLRLACRS